ncbi:MAG: hypothetical protein K6T68_08695, partial [Alicyclobacillus shizuokensis]|nr:hypothetical protein [Alicyclobacillus shizuokensis]
VVLSSGERLTVTTGSVSIVAQLARAVAIGALPLRCIPRVANKPTKQGYYPQHLEISRNQPQKKQEGTTEYVVTDDLPF